MIPGNIQERAPHPVDRNLNLEREEPLVGVQQRNAIAADLRQIQSDLRLDLLQARRDRGEALDSKTLLILEWYQCFSRVLNDNREQPQHVFNEFKNLLKEILVDSIYRSALDNHCLLGNDGETYTEMGLRVFRHWHRFNFNIALLCIRMSKDLWKLFRMYAQIIWSIG